MTAPPPNGTPVIGLAITDPVVSTFLADNLTADGYLVATDDTCPLHDGPRLPRCPAMAVPAAARCPGIDALVNIVRITQASRMAPLTIKAGHTEHELRTPFTYAEVRFVVGQLLAWGSLCDGDPCPECHAPGVVHKGVVQCDTRACPRYGETIRLVTAGDDVVLP